MEEHRQCVQLVLEHFEKFRIIINLVKFEFRKSDVIFLDHYIDSSGISLSPTKEEAILKFQVPDNEKAVTVSRDDDFFYKGFYKIMHISYNPKQTC